MKVRLNPILYLLVIVSMMESCKKEPDSAYPKSVSMQYKVIPSTGISQASSLIFTNDSGGLTTLSNQALPFIKTLTRVVNKGDAITLRGDALSGGQLQLEISIDGKVARQATFSGGTVVTGQLTYQFQ